MHQEKILTTRSILRLAYVVVFLGFFSSFSSCYEAERERLLGALEIEVAPLLSDDIAKACYTLAIYNDEEALVWAETNLCSDFYAAGPSAHPGSLRFSAGCDASRAAPLLGAESSIYLFIDGLYRDDNSLIQDFNDPCGPSGCFRKAQCFPNRPVNVFFDLAVVRSEEKGFFDVAVKVDDVYCSAKIDCLYPGTGSGSSNGAPLVFNPDNGERVSSLVFAIACGVTGNNSEDIHIYLTELHLHCGPGQDYFLSPVQGPGQWYQANDANRPAPLLQGVTYLDTGAFDAQGTKLSWITALGFNDSFLATNNCDFYAQASASKTLLPDGTTPAHSIYPVIEAYVDINNGSTYRCSHHPLGGLGSEHGSVLPVYTDPEGIDGPTSVSFDYKAYIDDGSAVMDSVTP